MGYMILEYTFRDNAFAELSGPNIKFWTGEGLPAYEGPIDGFENVHPLHFHELITKKVIKVKK